MFLLGLPHPTASPAGSGHAAISDPVATFLLLGVIFIPAMFVCFFLGLGHLIDWFQVRGWRHPSQRRKLK